MLDFYRSSILKKSKIRLFIFSFLFFSLVLTSSAFQYTGYYNDPLTSSVGDLRYCMQGGICNLSSLTSVNITSISYNVTEDMDIGGNLIVNGNVSADYFVGDGSKLTGIQQGNLVLYFNDKLTDCTYCPNNKTLTSEFNSTEITLSGSNLLDGATLLNEWVTNTGVPNLNVIKQGVYRVHVKGKKTDGTKDVRFYYEIYVINSTCKDEVLISTSEYSDYLTNDRKSLDIYTYINETFLNNTDRLRIKGYAFVDGLGSAPDVEAYIQGDSHTRIELPVGAVSIEKFVPYENAIKDVNLGSNNLKVNTINTTYIYGQNGGYLNMLGDPWYLNDIDLELSDDLIVNGDIEVDNSVNIQNDLAVVDAITSNSLTANWINIAGVFYANTWKINFSQDVLMDNNLNVTKTIYANNYIGDGSLLTGTGNSTWNESKANDLYVNVNGDTMEGNLNMDNHNITNTQEINATKYICVGITCICNNGEITSNLAKSISEGYCT